MSQKLVFDKGALGFTGEVENMDPNGQLYIVASFSKGGKSYFLQSNPDCLVINADCNPLVWKSPTSGKFGSRAQVWPVRQEGKIVTGQNPDGTPISVPEFKGEHLMQIADRLKHLAEKDLPRPKLVALDTVTTARELMKEVAHSNLNRKMKAGKACFEDWGQSGWRELNELLVGYGLLLYNYGYGFVWSMHLSERDIPAGDQVVKDPNQYVLNVTEGMWSRMQAYPSCVLTIHRKEDKVPDPKTGKFSTTERIVMKTQDRRISQQFSSRFNLPSEIELGAQDPWGDFARAFKESQE